MFINKMSYTNTKAPKTIDIVTKINKVTTTQMK